MEDDRMFVLLLQQLYFLRQGNQLQEMDLQLITNFRSKEDIASTLTNEADEDGCFVNYITIEYISSNYFCL